MSQPVRRGEFIARIPEHVERERVLALGLGILLDDLRADRDEARPLAFERRKDSLQSKLLGVAVRSPHAAIETQHEPPIADQITERHELVLGIRQLERRRAITRL